MLTVDTIPLEVVIRQMAKSVEEVKRNQLTILARLDKLEQQNAYHVQEMCVPFQATQMSQPTSYKPPNLQSPAPEMQPHQVPSVVHIASHRIVQQHKPLCKELLKPAHHSLLLKRC